MPPQDQLATPCLNKTASQTRVTYSSTLTCPCGMRFENVTERNKTRLRLHRKKCLLAQTNNVEYTISSENQHGYKKHLDKFRGEEGPLQAVNNFHLNHHEKKKLTFSENKEFKKQEK